MTEFWVSTPKYWCKFCKVWLTDNQQARRNHDNGRKHKETVLELRKAERDAELHGAASDKELRATLKDIEAAAQAAVAKDLSGSNHGFYVKPGSEPAAAVTALHRQASAAGQKFGAGDRAFVRREERERLEAEAEKKREEEAKEPGEYEVDGVRYLEAKRHAELLARGKSVQVWMEDRDAWLEGKVAQVDARQVPNTKLVVRKYAVVYRLPLEAVENGLPPNAAHVPEVQLGDLDVADLAGSAATADDAEIYDYLEATAEGGEGSAAGAKVAVAAKVVAAAKALPTMAFVREMEVPLERLRIVGKTAAEEAAAREREEREAAEKKAAAAPKLDDRTGIWGWETVSVKKVNVAKERKQEELREQRASEAGRPRARTETEDEKLAKADDALAAYDPSGRSKGYYRGVYIGGEGDALGLPDEGPGAEASGGGASGVENEGAAAVKAEQPVFKKRGRGQKGARNKRRKTSDNV